MLVSGVPSCRARVSVSGVSALESAVVGKGSALDPSIPCQLLPCLPAACLLGDDDLLQERAVGRLHCAAALLLV